MKQAGLIHRQGIHTLIPETIKHSQTHTWQKQSLKNIRLHENVDCRKIIHKLLRKLLISKINNAVSLIRDEGEELVTNF